MFLGLGGQGLQPLISILIFYRGIASSLWSGHILQVKFHCAGVIMCYCAKHNYIRSTLMLDTVARQPKMIKWKLYSLNLVSNFISLVNFQLSTLHSNYRMFCLITHRCLLNQVKDMQELVNMSQHQLEQIFNNAKWLWQFLHSNIKSQFGVYIAMQQL